MRRVLVGFLALGCSSLLAAACGSGGTFPGDEVPVTDDANADTTTPGQDSGNPGNDSGNDSTVQDSGPLPIDATLEVGFGDGAIWTADSGGGKDSGISIDGGGCSPDGILCSGNVAETCKNGQLTATTCTNGLICANGFGCVVCDPGSGSCNGNTGTLCKSDGSGYLTNNCDPQLGLTCNAGICLGDCSPSNIGQSYIGCEYYAVTMLNSQLTQTTFPFAISVANTTSKTAKVTITGPQAVTGNPFTINANTIQSIVLPWETSLSNNPNKTVIQTGGAYHIRSTEPVTVYQFNARDYQIGGSFSYTNDASLLIPVNALTGNYYVVTMPDWNALANPIPTNFNLSGLITIVGTTNNTSVTFTTNVNNAVIAGAGILASGSSTVTLNQGDVLQISSVQNGTGTSYGTDPSGSKVVANQPVEVFGGSDCANVPINQQACDHMEEIIFPLETLKSDYLVVPPNMTGITTSKKPSNFVRIVGTVNSTSLTYQPAQTGAPASLNAGQVGLFESSTPFRVTSTQPIIVGQYMESSNNYGGGTLNGDPAMSVAVATAQFRNSYAFTAPNNYYINWATVIAPTGNSVTIDTTTIPSTSFTAIGTSGYGFYYYQICNNGGSPTCPTVSSNHTASSAANFGIQVYGYGSYTSYWYPGGLNLTR